MLRRPHPAAASRTALVRRPLALVVTLVCAVGTALAAEPAHADPPRAAADYVVAYAGTTTSFDVLVNDDDPDGEPFTLTDSTAPLLGKATCAQTGVCTYTAPAAPGQDEFTYTISNGTDTSTATVHVTVDPLPEGAIISAGPLTQIRISPVLNCAVNRLGDDMGEFYKDTACGTFLVVDDTLFSPRTIPDDPSAVGTPWTPVSQTPVTGTGTMTDPFQLVTTVAAGDTGVTLVETDSYVVGEESYVTSIAIHNSGSARTVRLYRAADCYLNDSDLGTGAVDAATGAVACTSPQTGRIEQWFPLTSGSHFLEAGYSDVWQTIGAKLPFPDTCLCDAAPHDNGAGLQWDLSLTDKESATVSSLVTFSPSGAQPLVTTKTVAEAQAATGARVHYTITLRNPGATAAHLTQVNDVLPAGFAYVEGSTTGLTTADPASSSGGLTWSVDAAVAPRGEVTLTFAATTAAAPGTYYNNATGQAVDEFVVPTGATAPVTTTVVNHVPVAEGDHLTTAQDTPGTVDVLANDTDADGDTLTVSGHGTPGHGSVSCTATACTYTPAAGYSGSDTFTYQVDDGHGGTATGTVDVTVTPAPAPSTDVSIVKRALPSVVKVGNTSGWQLTVRNGSSVAAGHVVVTDVLPQQFRYWKATGAGCAASSAGRPSTSLTCDLGTLQAGETRVIVVRGAFVAPGWITNTARVSADHDGSPLNNVSTASTRATGERCTMVGTFGADHLHGTRRRDVVCGLDGGDRIDTRGGGRDVIYGNDGHDRCTGDRRDRVYG